MRYSSYSVRRLETRPGKPWQARLKYKQDGKWKETSKILKEAKGKREATRMALDWFNEMNAVAETQPVVNDKTVEEAVYDYLDYQLALGQIEQSTHDNQETIVKTYISPMIGSYAFKTLDRNAIVRWHTQLSQKGLKQISISRIMRTVSKVYSYAEMVGDIPSNPFNKVKIQSNPGVKVTHLTPEQAERYLSCVYAEYNPEDWMYAVCLLAYYGGLRGGEIAGLRWSDINFTDGTLTVSTAVGMKKGGSYTKHPKTKSSIRTFPMIGQLKQILTSRYKAIEPLDNYFVASDNGATHKNPKTIQKNFYRFIRRNNLLDAYGNYITLHSLRHNLGYVAVRSGVDIASLSHIFGHASKALTLDVYSDSDRDAMALASIKLEETFKKTDLPE